MNLLASFGLLVGAPSTPPTLGLPAADAGAPSFAQWLSTFQDAAGTTSTPPQSSSPALVGPQPEADSGAWGVPPMPKSLPTQSLASPQPISEELEDAFSRVGPFSAVPQRPEPMPSPADAPGTQTEPTVPAMPPAPLAGALPRIAKGVATDELPSPTRSSPTQQLPPAQANEALLSSAVFATPIAIASTPTPASGPHFVGFDPGTLEEFRPQVVDSMPIKFAPPQGGARVTPSATIPVPITSDPATVPALEPSQGSAVPMPPVSPATNVPMPETPAFGTVPAVPVETSPQTPAEPATAVFAADGDAQIDDVEPVVASHQRDKPTARGNQSPAPTIPPRPEPVSLTRETAQRVVLPSSDAGRAHPASPTTQVVLEAQPLALSTEIPPELRVDLRDVAARLGRVEGMRLTPNHGAELEMAVTAIEEAAATDHDARAATPGLRVQGLDADGVPDNSLATRVLGERLRNAIVDTIVEEGRARLLESARHHLTAKANVHPAHLGRVDIEIEQVDGDRLRILLQASGEDARSALDAQREDLMADLGRHGFDVEDFETRADGPGDGSGDAVRGDGSDSKQQSKVRTRWHDGAVDLEA